MVQRHLLISELPIDTRSSGLSSSRLHLPYQKPYASCHPFVYFIEMKCDPMLDLILYKGNRGSNIKIRLFNRGPDFFALFTSFRE